MVPVCGVNGSLEGVQAALMGAIGNDARSLESRITMSSETGKNHFAFHMCTIVDVALMLFVILVDSDHLAFLRGDCCLIASNIECSETS
jgi:hypothetical protein